MTLTSRDRKLALFLPGLLVLFGYGFWYATTARYKLLPDALKAATAAEDAAPGANQLHAEQHRLADANRRLADAGKKRDEAAARFTRQLGCLACDQRADRLRRLTDLFARHHLTVIEHGDAAGGRESLPPAAEALKKHLPPGATPHLHAVRFAARFPDAYRATQELSRDGALAVPVSLTMKELPGGEGWMEWQLLVWV